MSTKHVKLNRPTNVDLVRNPLIGGSKGTTMAGVTPEELEEFAGANTFEGDIENDTNPQGGIDKTEVRDSASRTTAKRSRYRSAKDDTAGKENA